MHSFDRGPHVCRKRIHLPHFIHQLDPSSIDLEPQEQGDPQLLVAKESQVVAWLGPTITGPKETLSPQGINIAEVGNLNHLQNFQFAEWSHPLRLHDI